MTKKQMDRCLREFPWLWAIKPLWSPTEDEIEVHVADDKSFDAELELGQRAWVYTTPDKGPYSGCQIIKPALGGWDARVGSHMLFADSNWGSEGLKQVAISNITTEETGIHVQVFRAPKDRTLWELLQRYNPRAKQAAS